LRRQCGILEDSNFGIVSKKEIMDMADFNSKNVNKKPNVKNNGDNRNKKPASNNRGTKTAHKQPLSLRQRGIKSPEDAGKVIEYKMSVYLANTILEKNKSNRDEQEILCEYVNTQLGLKDYCVRVSYF
jgi:hypothetical protein